MKKQTQRTTATKKTSQQAKTETKWFDHAKILPLALFHTTIGPVIGRVEVIKGPEARSFNLRLWAPAAIRMGFQPNPLDVVTGFTARYAVTFQPIALVETYLDLSAETPFGRSPVPEALVASYEDYFARVVAGEYSFAQVTAHVQQAAPHAVPIEPRVDDELATGNPTPADPNTEPAESETDESTLS